MLIAPLTAPRGGGAPCVKPAHNSMVHATTTAVLKFILACCKLPEVLNLDRAAIGLNRLNQTILCREAYAAPDKVRSKQGCANMATRVRKKREEQYARGDQVTQLICRCSGASAAIASPDEAFPSANQIHQSSQRRFCVTGPVVVQLAKEIETVPRAHRVAGHLMAAGCRRS